MKKIIFLLAFLACFSVRTFAQKEKDKIEASVVQFFDGLSELNTDKLKKYSTADFLLLENGEVWNLDTLISKLSSRKNLNVQRVNKFQFIKTEQSGHMAWVSYYNTAEFKLTDKQQTVRWLESAVLIKEKGSWKIKLLHSTKLK